MSVGAGVRRTLHDRSTSGQTPHALRSFRSPRLGDTPQRAGARSAARRRAFARVTAPRSEGPARHPRSTALSPAAPGPANETTPFPSAPAAGATLLLGTYPGFESAGCASAMDFALAILCGVLRVSDDMRRTVASVFSGVNLTTGCTLRLPAGPHHCARVYGVCVRCGCGCVCVCVCVCACVCARTCVPPRKARECVCVPAEHARESARRVPSRIRHCDTCAGLAAPRRLNVCA